MATNDAEGKALAGAICDMFGEGIARVAAERTPPDPEAEYMRRLAARRLAELDPRPTDLGALWLAMTAAARGRAMNFAASLDACGTPEAVAAALADAEAAHAATASERARTRAVLKRIELEEA